MHLNLKTKEMKKVLLYVCLILAIAGTHSAVVAQCPNDNVQDRDTTYDVVCDTGFQTLNDSMYGGQYALVNVTEGNMYTFRTCGDEDFDTEITLYNNVEVMPLAYS